MNKIYSIPVMLAIAAIMMFGQGSGAFLGIQKAFGYGGGGGGYVAPASKVGDVNNDGIVGENDFALLMSQWGQTGNTLSTDLNHDGLVNEDDFSLLMSTWTA
jgi:hypothetical protein